MQRETTELKRCMVCSRVYRPAFDNQQVCKKCFRMLTGRVRVWDVHTDINNRELEIRKEWMEHAPAKNDSIIGAGYAERQKADTLSKVEKIKTEL